MKKILIGALCLFCGLNSDASLNTNNNTLITIPPT